MNRNQVFFFAISVAVAFGVLVVFTPDNVDHPNPTAADEKTSERVFVDQPNRRKVEQATADVVHLADDAPADFEALKRRFGVDYDPMLIMALGNFTEAEIDEYNRLHIIPFNPAVGQECNDEPDPQLVGQMVRKCKTLRANPDHPYTLLDNSALVDLAVHDAAAALILGRRSRNEEERLRWYLRATALSEKSGDLLALAEHRYSRAFVLKRVGDKLEKQAQPENIISRIALETVAARLGDPRAKPERWQNILSEATAAETLEASLTKAQNLADEYLTRMSEIQRATTGSTSIQGVIDA